MITELISSLFARILGDRLQDRHRRVHRLPWKSVAKVSRRLNQIIRLASTNNHENETLSYLVEVNPGVTLTQIEKAKSGVTEPSIDLVKQVCESLGASFRYVWHGKGSPFEPREEDYIPVREYLSLFREPGLNTIWFVRATKYPHVSFIVLRYNEFKYRVLPHLFHVSAENGNGGAASLSELAYLSENYHKARLYEVVAWGLEVPSDIAQSVLDGTLHASVLFQNGSKRSYWWDDLADIEHKRPCAREYRARYDEEFFHAQNLIAGARKGSHNDL